MKRLGLALGLLSIAVVAMADVPQEINYQGKLREYGVPVTGTRTMNFRIYHSEAGLGFEWESGNISVAVSSGVFNCTLSPAVDWRKKDLWIETMVSGKTLTPREKLTAQPFALHADTAEGITKNDGESIEFKIGNECKASISSNGESSCTVNGTTFYMVPRGAIIMWSGALATIPQGWAVCDGSNNTPDLRDRFVIGAGQNYAVGFQGGSSNHSHSIVKHSHDYTHSHSFNGTTGGSSSNFGSGGGTTSAADYHHNHVYSGRTVNDSEPLTTSEVVVNSDSRSNLPPFVSLYFIMKL